MRIEKMYETQSADSTNEYRHANDLSLRNRALVLQYRKNFTIGLDHADRQIWVRHTVYVKDVCHACSAILANESTLLVSYFLVCT